MIIWISSYPKSGNTYVRSFLSAYYYSKSGEFDFNLLLNIKQFPSERFANSKSYTFINAAENWINNQNIFFDKNKIFFLKTHNSLEPYFGNKFTTPMQTLGAIYIVRDPRNIVTSFSKFRSLTIEQTADFMISGTGDGLVWTNNWSVNYHSWKLFKEYERYLLVKYEDLISEPDKTFLNILEFVHKLNKTNFKLDKKKFENVIKTTSFDSMQKLEKEKGFTESWVDEKTGKKIPFFYLGPKNDWKKKLDTKIAEKLEKAFKSEMEELGYL